MKRISILLIIVISGCATHQKSTTTTNQNNICTDGKLYTSLFQQRAAEYDALCIQAYNLARLRLDEALKNTTIKPKAIVSDIDETIIDNSPYAVKQALQGKEYDLSTWKQWTTLAKGDTISGAAGFFKYAADNNVEVFYITNRNEDEKEGTIQNLKKYGFPFADNSHVLLRQSTSSKEERRQRVSATHEIIMLLGDNLADFSAAFDKKSTTDRMQATKHLAGEFGSRYIVLPNANYGDWEGAVYNYNYKLSPLQKDSAVKSNLDSY